MKPLFFESAAGFRAWLARHGQRASEAWVGFYKKASRKAGITYHEALDEALCVGWIDGLKKGYDESSYVHRFSPRKPKSKWSAANLRRMQALLKAGRVTAAGRRVFDDRDRKASGYSVAAGRPTLDRASLAKLKANAAAWAFFRSQPPGYQRLVVRWVRDAKRDATRTRRLEILIACSAAGTRISMLAPGRSRP